MSLVVEVTVFTEPQHNPLHYHMLVLLRNKNLNLAGIQEIADKSYVIFYVTLWARLDDCTVSQLCFTKGSVYFVEPGTGHKAFCSQFSVTVYFHVWQMCQHCNSLCVFLIQVKLTKLLCTDATLWFMCKLVFLLLLFSFTSNFNQQKCQTLGARCVSFVRMLSSHSKCDSQWVHFELASKNLCG